MVEVGESYSYIGVTPSKIEAAVRADFPNKAYTDAACVLNLHKNKSSRKIANISLYAKKTFDKSKSCKTKTLMHPGTLSGLNNIITKQ